MCGIAGFFYRTPGSAKPAGKNLLQMLSLLQGRGPDSAGVAIYGEAVPGEYTYSIIRHHPDAQAIQAVAEAMTQANRAAVTGVEEAGCHLFVRAQVNGDPLALVPILEALPNLSVSGVGRSLTLVKDVGSVRQLGDLYTLSDRPGRHAIGHTRMATESRVDVMHCHPFWSRYRPDLCIVHNGHITNDYKLRLALRNKGYDFETDNDSEVVAVYISDKLEQGCSLKQALQSVTADLDGTYVLSVATADAVGVIRDPLGIKSLVLVETEEMVAFATEITAVRSVCGGKASIREINAGEVCVWQ